MKFIAIDIYLSNIIQFLQKILIKIMNNSIEFLIDFFKYSIFKKHNNIEVLFF